MPLRFDVDYGDANLKYEPLIDEVFAELKSSFIEMPRGDGFVEYSIFERGYQALKHSTNDFTNVTAQSVEDAVVIAPIALVVFRSILGFSPPEWAYVATERMGLEIDQGAARAIDRNARLQPLTARSPLGSSLTDRRLRALIETGVSTLLEGVGPGLPSVLHRLDKADTKDGVKSLQPLADLGVPYAVLLYERFLGRPFASHRDAVSELVGEVVER